MKPPPIRSNSTVAALEAAQCNTRWNAAQVQEAPVRPGAIAKIRERIADLKAQQGELAGLEFALRALEEEHGA